MATQTTFVLSHQKKIVLIFVGILKRLLTCQAVELLMAILESE